MFHQFRKMLYRPDVPEEIREPAPPVEYDSIQNETASCMQQYLDTSARDYVIEMHESM